VNASLTKHLLKSLLSGEGAIRHKAEVFSEKSENPVKLINNINKQRKKRNQNHIETT